MKLFTLVLIVFLFTIPVVSQTSTPKTIHFKELLKFFPTKTPTGFTAEKPKGQSFASAGMSTSTASIEFVSPQKEKQLTTLENGKEDSIDVDITWRITIEITDYAGMGEGVFTSLQMMASVEFENETENGYEKSIVYNTFKGIEKLSAQEYSKSCSVQLIVGDRFLVTISGNGFADIALLHLFLKEIDLKKLQATK